MQLARHADHVEVVFPQRVLREEQPRPEIAQVNLHPSVLNPVPQYIQDPARVDLVSDPDRERAHRGILIPAMQLDQLLEPLDLSLPDELPHLGGSEPKLRVVTPRPPLPPPLQQLELDDLFKGRLGMHSGIHTVIPPVTAAVISACRRSARRSLKRSTSSRSGRILVIIFPISC